MATGRGRSRSRPLAGLTLKPPKDYSGTLNLTLAAYALEANGQVATTTRAFTVTVAPQADTVSLNAQNVAGQEDLPVTLNLGLAMEDRTASWPAKTRRNRCGSISTTCWPVRR